MDASQSPPSLLPHHQLRAYGTALEFLRAVRDAGLRDRELRTQALRAAKSVCLNLAEGAGRVTRADKARAYTVARGELVEAIAAVEISHETGDARRDAVARVLTIGGKLYAVLSKLVR
jgi:four helix bundle protein